MDIHEVPGGVSAEDVAKAHAEDVKIEDKYGVHYHKYWVNEKAGKIFCLCHAPNAEAAAQVHREAHGMVADKIIEIQPEIADGFLGGVEVNEAGAALVPGATNDRDPGIRTILFTDIVESTTLTQTLGDEAALAMLGVHDTIVRDALSASGGREVKHTGDGIMASFTSVASSVTFAITAQRAFRDHNEDTLLPLDVKIGISAGEPITDHNGDLFGASVQLAARLCDSAPAGEIAVSLVVRELCVGKRFHFQDCGPVQLKGLSEPTSLYCVSWRDG